MPKTTKPTDNTSATTTTSQDGAATTVRHPAWHVRFPGATPHRVTVEQAWSRYPEDLHIVGAGSRDVVHGRWGSKLYSTWAEAIAASIQQQQTKIHQLEAEQAAAHVQLERLRTLTEPEPEPEPDPEREREPEPEPQANAEPQTRPQE